MDTFEEFAAFVQENLPGATLVMDGDEIVVRTGLGYDMGNRLYVLSEAE